MNGSEQDRALTSHVVGMALEADPLDGRGLILEQPPVVAIDIAFLALPLSNALRARANDDEDALKQVQTVRPCFRTDRGRRIPHVENGPQIGRASCRERV